MSVDYLHVLAAFFFFAVWFGITLLMGWLQTPPPHDDPAQKFERRF